jgi:hypothetical protein
MPDINLLVGRPHECLPNLVADVNLGPPAPLTCNPHVSDRGFLKTAPGSPGSLPPGTRDGDD